MDEKRVKLNDGTKGEDEPKIMALDRLSELPDPIIHKIFAHIPTIVSVRMTVLSKRWRRMWLHLPRLTFSDRAIDPTFDQRKFFKFVDTCMELRRSDIADPTEAKVTDFKLLLSEYDPKSNRPISNWLTSVAQSNVRELLVDIDYQRVSFRVPLDLLQSRSITVLRLRGVRFWGVKTVSLPSLISLSLESIDITDKSLGSILSGCYSLERLLVRNCGPLYDAEIPNPSLKSLEIDGVEYYARFYVKARNLESFSCNKSGAFVLFLPSLGTGSYFEALRSVSFTSCLRLYDDRLEELVPKLPALESLAVCDCERLFDVKISSRALKRLVFRGNGEWGIGVGASLDCPDLVDLDYDGFLKLKFSTKPRKLFGAEIRLEDPRDSDTCRWHTNLLEFLSSLDCSERLSLDVCSEEDLIPSDELRRACEAPLPILKHLSVKTRKPSTRNAELRVALTWIAPSLETLSIKWE